MIEKIVLSTVFWTVSVPLISGIVLWLLNERSKRTVSIREKKQECYKAILGSLPGLLEGSRDHNKISDFVDNWNRLWIYAPDKVVRSAKKYIELMISNSEEEERSNALKELIIVIRKDSQLRTGLSMDEYIQVSPEPSGQQSVPRMAKGRR